MELKRYNVTVNDRRSTKTVLQLSDEDAQRAGLTEKDLWTPDGKAAAKPAAAKKAAPKAPANKSRTPRNKAAAKPATSTPPASAAVEDASDPDASE